MFRKSITFQLTLLFASISTAVLLILGLLVGRLVESHFEEMDAGILWSEYQRIAGALTMARTTQELSSLPQEHSESLSDESGMTALVIGPDGRQVFAAGSARFPDTMLVNANEHMYRPTRWTDAQNHAFRGVVAKAMTGIPGSGPATVAVAMDLEHHERFMASFRFTLWIVVGGAAVVSSTFGWIVVRRGLRPLRDIGQSAGAITATRLDQRIPADAFPKELAEVASSLNEMITGLQDSFRRLSDFSADLAHELRTPVSNLLTQTQVTLSKARAADEYRNVLISNVEEFERLSRTIEDMLYLAKADNNLLVPNREAVDLRKEVAEVLEFYEAVAEEREIKLNCSGDGCVSGDKLMLRRALSNLVSNAVRHTPKGGSIVVRIASCEPASVKVSVENTGESIAAEHLPRLFDRFYRADASRRHVGEGAGLGLAITRSIARAHGGDTSVRSERGLTTFNVTLPARPSVSGLGSVHGEASADPKGALLSTSSIAGE